MSEESAVTAGSPPAWSVTNLRMPSGIRVHFDPTAPAATTPASSLGTGGNGVSPTPGSVPGSPSGTPAEFNWASAPAEFRGAYEDKKRELEELRGKYQPWEKLGAAPDQVAQTQQTWTRMSQEAEQLGQALGYDLNEVRQLFGQDPVAVLAHLRQKAQTQQSQPLDPTKIRSEVQRMLQEAMRPMNEQYHAQREKEAEGRFDTTFERLYKNEFKDGLPDKARQALYEMASNLMGEDADAIKRLMGGQTSDVAKYFTAAKERFLEVITAYNGWEQEKVKGHPPLERKTPDPEKDWRKRTLPGTGQKLGDLFR